MDHRLKQILILQDGIVVAVPAGSPIGGALEAETIVMPAPVVPAPIVPAPIVVEPETSASSPLVQIILNVRKSEVNIF